MTTEQQIDAKTALQRFSALPERLRLRGLIRAAYIVTIGARDTYAPDAAGLRSPERLRVANELLHSLIEAALALAGGEKGCSDEVLVNIIFEMAPRAGIYPHEIVRQLLKSDYN